MSNEELNEEKTEDADLEVVYVQGMPVIKGADGKLYGMYPITRPEDIENLYQYLENFTADSGMTSHIADTSIHTSAEEKANWETGVANATSALSQAESLSALLAEVQGRLEKVEDSVESNITANPFSVTADTLDGITLTKGIWNQTKGRIEC